MKRRFLLALLGFGAAFLPLNFQMNAEDTAGRVPIEQTLAEIGKLDEDFRQQAEKLDAVIDTELSAKRVSENVAHSLHWSLRSVSFSSNADASTLLGVNHLPVENAQIMSGIKTLESEAATDLRHYTELVQAAVHEAGLRISEIAHTAEKPADIDPLLATLERLQQIASNRNPNSAALRNINSLASYGTFLRDLRRVVAMDPQASPVTLGSALGQLQTDVNSIRTTVDESVIQKRILEAIGPYQKAADDAQQFLDRAIQEKKSPVELHAALAHFEESTERLRDARKDQPATQYRSRETSGLGILTLYRNLIQAAGAMGAGDLARARNLLVNLHEPNLQSFDAARTATFSALVADWEKNLAEKTREAGEKQCDELARSLTAVNIPADLEAISNKVTLAETDQTRERNPMLPQGMGAQLRELATAWSSANPALIPSKGLFQPATGSLGGELAALRHRITRDIFARALNAPELNQPPLADLPPDMALDKLSDEAAGKADWRRLLLLTEYRVNSVSSGGTALDAGELSAALRAFLAGQNFELAEQWPDAIQCYKTVLRCTDRRAPIQQAADRLKALGKSHPEGSPGPIENSLPVLRAAPTQ